MKAKNRRWVIILLVILILLCLCCIVIGYFWYTGWEGEILGFSLPEFPWLPGGNIVLDEPADDMKESPPDQPSAVDDTTPPTPTPEPVETISIFTPFGEIQIKHGSGMSWITFLPYVVDSNLQPVDGAEISASMQYPDGSSQSLSGVTDALGIAELVFEIFTYGDYLLVLDSIAAPGLVYMPEYNFASEIPVNVGPSELTYAPPMQVVGFYTRFNQAMSEGDTEFLYNSLHPAVIEQYGEPMCRDYIASVIGNPIEVYVYQLAGYGTWDWPVNSHSVLIPGAYTIEAEIALPNNGGIVEQETHLAIDPRMMNQLSWLTYCDLVNSE